MGNGLFDLGGRIALLTGSSGGLGFAMARGLAQAGAAVVLNGRNAEKLQQAVEQLRSEGLSAHGFAFDVTDAAAVASAADEIERQVGPIDVLVNNAGIQRRAPFAELTEQQWREVIEVNLTGVFLVAQAVAARMVQRRRGKIINICSLMSEVGRPTIANYTAAKGGVKMLTKAMAAELGPHNVQVNGLGPGYFVTEMTRPLVENEQFNAWVRSRTPAGRWGQPKDLVGPAVFLASSASDFVNGHILYVDGGILATL